MDKTPAGYLGIPGSFSFIALESYFGHGYPQRGYKDFSQLLEGLKRKEISHCLLPIENSISGSLVKNYDMLSPRGISSICGELYLHVQPYLVVKQPLKVSGIHTVYAHPESFNQCDEVLTKMAVRRIAVSDSASAADYIATEGKYGEAALSSHDAAKRYGLTIVSQTAGSFKTNITRFFILSNHERQSNRMNKASIVYRLKHKPGTLFTSLGMIARRNLNLTKIESRPIPEDPFTYRFFVDFEFNEPSVAKEAIDEFKKETLSFQLLGMYQKGDVYES